MVKVKDSIFGSRWERRLFTALESAWPGKLDIYPNLPWLNVFDWSGLKVGVGERSFLKATSIDYTVCLHGSEKPLMSVEFDGLGHGYNCGSQYRQVAQTGDPYRADKLSLKLRIAEQLGYPFFVVSYDEAGDLVDDDKVNITHGIVGGCMTSVHMQAAIDERVNEIKAQNFTESEEEDLFQNVVIDVETELEFEWNPLIRAAACAMSDAFDAGMKSYSSCGLTDPPLPSPPLLGAWQVGDAETIRKRVEMMFSARRHGARITAEGNGLSITKETWVRNIEGPGVLGFGIADDVAKLLTFREFTRVAGKPVQNRHWGGQ